MDWSVEVVKAPAGHPVTLAQAKQHLRVTHDDEDALIEQLIAAATRDAERYQGRSYITRTLRLRLAGFPSGPIRLPYPPLVSVESITYTAQDGATVAVPPEAYVVLPGEIAEVRPVREWPAEPLWPGLPVSITYQAGYGDDPTAVPETARQAILLLVGHWYEHREAVHSGRVAAELPLGVGYLLVRDRVWPGAMP